MHVDLWSFPHRSQVSPLPCRGPAYAAAGRPFHPGAGSAVHQRRTGVDLTLQDWTKQIVMFRNLHPIQTHKQFISTQIRWWTWAVPERGAIGLENSDVSWGAVSMAGDVGMGWSSVDVSWALDRCDGGERGSSLAAANTETVYMQLSDKPDEKILIIKCHMNVTHGSEGLSCGSEMMVKTSWLKTERLNLKIRELEPKFIRSISKLFTNIELYRQLNLNLIPDHVNSNSWHVYFSYTNYFNKYYIHVIYHIC